MLVNIYGQISDFDFLFMSFKISQMIQCNVWLSYIVNVNSMKGLLIFFLKTIIWIEGWIIKIY